MKRLTLVLTLLFVVGCGGKGVPTLVPTLGTPSTATPVPLTATVPPMWTPEPTDTPWGVQTPTLQVTDTPTGTLAICDTAVLDMYVGFIEQLDGVYASLERQSFNKDTILASIPRLEGLREQAENLPAHCDRAFWLRQMLVDEINRETERLGELAKNMGQDPPEFEFMIKERRDMALDALRQEVEEETALQGQPTETPTLPTFDCSGDVYDCPYFHSQFEAQQCYDYCFPKAGDIHRLDPDGNGVACESLP